MKRLVVSVQISVILISFLCGCVQSPEDGSEINPQKKGFIAGPEPTSTYHKTRTEIKEINKMLKGRYPVP